MERRSWLKWLAIVIAFFTGVAVAESAEEPVRQDSPMPGVTVLDLEQTLKSGLKARRPVEFDFIRLVVLKVKDNEIPIELVQSTFLWARRQAAVPYPYFERGLRERAARLGIAL